MVRIDFHCSDTSCGSSDNGYLVFVITYALTLGSRNKYILCSVRQMNAYKFIAVIKRKRDKTAVFTHIFECRNGAALCYAALGYHVEVKPLFVKRRNGYHRRNLFVRILELKQVDYIHTL